MDNIQQNPVENFNSLCTPAKIFFAVQLVFLLIMVLKIKGKLSAKLVYACVIFLWTFIYDALCKNGWTSVSWFILILTLGPISFIGLTFFVIKMRMNLKKMF
tara:strand:- start:109 stop:414 length:306 start_codon:yes stop_codon:yes gene_type:complete